MNLLQLKAQFRHDQRLAIADQRESVRAWIEQEHADFSEEPYLMRQLAERLGRLLEFLSAGKTPSSFAVRTWCMLYAVRPDLVSHEAIQVAADRFGISQQRLCQQLQVFKERTGFTYACRVGKRSLEGQRKVTDAMTAARIAKGVRFRNRQQLAVSS